MNPIGATPVSSGPASPARAGVSSPDLVPLVPDYDLLRRIEAGSYGEVWLARSRATGALRAAKIIWRKAFDDDRPFQREFEGVQRFERISREHSSQLALYHIGRNEAEGCFYYVMELADAAVTEESDQCSVISDQSAGACVQSSVVSKQSGGSMAPHSLTMVPGSLTTDHCSLITDYHPRTLRADLEAGRLPAAQVLEIGLALTEALSHLHRNGLVHRDVKPSNVIFVGGRPKLADIGLVTDTSDTCSIVGTEGYLPPEGPGTPSADLFALGKVLYEATTGLDRRQLPKLPEDLRSWSDASQVFELNEIILKACAREAGDRYASAEAMHADLALLQRGDSVRQKYTRVRRWHLVKRTALAAGLIAGVVALAAVLYRQTATDYEGKPSSNTEANRLFEIGRHLHGKGTIAETRRAIDYFSQATRLDTNFAMGYAWLAASQCWDYLGTNRMFEFIPQARLNALHALALDPSLGKAHQALAWHAFVEEWDWRAAEAHFKAAHRCAPRDAEIYEWEGLILGWAGHTNEAIANLQAALRLKPDSISARYFLGSTLRMARRYDEAIAILTTVTQMEPAGVLGGNSVLARTLIDAGRLEEAIERSRLADIQNGVAEVEANERAQATLAAYRSGGARGYWEHRLSLLKAGDGPYYAAYLHARLGHLSEALESLEEAERVRDGNLALNIMIDPAMDPLRDQPRFKALLKALRLPE